VSRWRQRYAAGGGIEFQLRHGALDQLHRDAGFDINDLVLSARVTPRRG
jgi:hypothetical protein